MSDLLFLPLKILLIGIDLFITLITFQWLGALVKFLDHESLRSIKVSDDEAHRCHPWHKNKLSTTPREGVATLYDLVKDATERFGDRKCMGSREFVGWKVPGKVKEFAGVSWKTYSQMGEQAYKFGAALRSKGMQPAAYSTTLDKVTIPCRIAIFENTCAEWMIAAMGAFTQSITVATVYATLGIDAVVEAVVDNVIPVMVCNKKDVGRLVAKIGNMPTLKTIVYTSDLCEPGLDVDMPSAPRGVTIISFEDFVASGDVNAYPPTPPKADTAAVIMYTSGSTGKPKGVVITHRQIVAAISAGDLMLGIKHGEEVYLAYLPLAHIMELMAEFVMIAFGCTLCYADPKSLTTTGAFPVGALELYSPTLMVAVPKIWDVIKKGIQAKVALTSPLAQFLVKTAFEWRSFALKNGFDTPLFKALVFKKFSKVVGGKLRMGVSGGGPLNGEIQDFCRTAFGMPLIQGYGLTETCAGLTMQDPLDTRPGIAGMPITSCEIKLVSTPEVGDKAGQPYLSTDRMDVEGEPIFGRGEIVTRGVNLSCGYYMEQEKTKEEYKEDGWFYTGDIGQWMNDGSIRIVDRKKNLVKLKGGEYVALEKMEGVYGNSNFVDAIAGGICCCADGDMDRPVAIMQLNETVSMAWAKANGVAGDFDTVKDSKELYTAIMADMHAQQKKSDLSHLEKIIAVSLLTTHWTAENGCLTAANKLQRRTVVQMFEKEFEEVKKKGVFA